MQRLEDEDAALAARNGKLDQATKTIKRIAFADALITLQNRRAFERTSPTHKTIWDCHTSIWIASNG